MSEGQGDLAIAAVEGTSSEESLLPMHNRATVIRAEVKADANPGDGRGVVLARANKHGEWVTWRVRRDAGDLRWHATDGDYHRKLSDAVKSYNLRTGREG
jgi:hypothetical protein